MIKLFGKLIADPWRSDEDRIELQWHKCVRICVRVVTILAT